MNKLLEELVKAIEIVEDYRIARFKLNAEEITSEAGNLCTYNPWIGDFSNERKKLNEEYKLNEKEYLKLPEDIRTTAEKIYRIYKSYKEDLFKKENQQRKIDFIDKCREKKVNSLQV